MAGLASATLMYQTALYLLSEIKKKKLIDKNDIYISDVLFLL